MQVEGKKANSPVLKFEKGFLNQADGSSRFTIDRTSVLCSVFGPIEAKPMEEIPDKAYIEVLVVPEVGLSGTHERLFELNLKSTLETLILVGMNPRTKYKLMFQILENSGLSEAAALNACSIALVDSGIPISSIITASSCCILENGAVISCPNNDQIKESASFHTFAFSGLNSDSPVFVNSKGNFSLEEYIKCQSVCQLQAQKIYDFLVEKLETSFH